jgi:hypothetical protein
MYYNIDIKIKKNKKERKKLSNQVLLFIAYRMTEENNEIA